MRKILFFCFLFFGNISVFAFVDEIYVYEESNTLFQIKTGNSKSKEQQILKTYIQLINNFVREIDSTQTVFIQFDQQDYYCDHSFYTLSYGNFSDFALYGKITYPNSKDISKKFDYNGIIIYFSNNFLKLKPLLQLIEFGLKNKNEIIKNQQFVENKIDTTQFLEDRSSSLEVLYKNIVSNNLNSLIYSRLHNNVINSILNNPVTQIQSDYLEIKTNFSYLYPELSKNKYNLYFKNDSCYISNGEEEICTVNNIYGIRFVIGQNSLFIFDTQESFIFIDLNTKKYSPKLPFKIYCFQGMCFTILSVIFDNERNKFKIQLTSWIDPEENEIIYPNCLYDSSLNLIIPNQNKP